jgi:GTP cyclohydrolase FolE2
MARYSRDPQSDNKSLTRVRVFQGDTCPCSGSMSQLASIREHESPRGQETARVRASFNKASAEAPLTSRHELSAR